MLTAVQHVSSLQHLIGQTTMRPEEKGKLLGELAEARVKLTSVEAQAKVYEAKIRELEVRSPIDGQVVTWDIKNRLKRRPVQKGMLLLRVANPDGEWQLELHMAENRMGHITKAQQKFKAEKEHGEELPVTYILATEPGTYRQGKVSEVQQSAELHGEEGNTVLIKVAIDKADLSEAALRPGATVTAKVYCGRRPIGYVWFHDLIAFVQSRILFKL
jgi:hypothetical protein